MEKEESSLASKKKKKKKKIQIDEDSDVMEYTNFEDEIFHKVGVKYNKAFMTTSEWSCGIKFWRCGGFFNFTSFEAYFRFLEFWILLKQKSDVFRTLPGFYV